MSAFNYKGQPSTFTGTAFTATPKGLSASQTASIAVARKTKRTGRSPGSINGLSKKGDDHIIAQPPHRGHTSGRIV